MAEWVKDRSLSNLAKGLDPAKGADVTHPVADMIRWNSALSKWQIHNGTTWVDLSASYDIAITGGVTLGLSGNGIVVRTAASTYTNRTLQQPAAGITITNGSGVGGDPTFALANDLAALEALAGTGIAVHTGTSTWVERSLTQPAAGLTITNNTGVAGNPTFALANDLAALEALGSTGFAARTGSDAWAQRTLTGTANRITITNTAGVAGDPVFDIGTDVVTLNASQVLTGKTLTAPTITNPTISGIVGSSITGTFKETIWIPAGAFNPRLTAGATNYLAELSTNKALVRAFAFDPGTAEFIQFETAMPKGWNEGTITAQFYWTVVGGTATHVVRWGISGVALSDDDPLDVAQGTVVTVDDAKIADNDQHRSAETGAVTIAGTPAEGDLVRWEVSRDATNGADTLTVDALFTGIKLFLTRNQLDDT